MKALDAVKTMKFNNPADILNYFKVRKITHAVDPDTKDRIYVLNPETNRSYTYLVKEDKNKQLYLEKIQRRFDMKIIIEAEDTILHSRDPLHIMICEKYPHRVVKAKKGKGSYKRKEKHKKDLREAD